MSVLCVILYFLSGVEKVFFEDGIAEISEYALDSVKNDSIRATNNSMRLKLKRHISQKMQLIIMENIQNE